MKQLLIVIDMQNGFLNKLTATLPNKIAELISTGKFSDVIFTKFVNQHNTNFTRLLGKTRMRSRTETDIAAPLLPWVQQSGVFLKQTYSAFGNQSFATYLKRHEIRTITLCGVDLDGCVLATAFDAFDRGYQVTILQDYCGSSGGATIAQAAQRVIRRNIG